ncbi:3-deoxy-D-manno-octulosonic-acid transferase [Desulfacinum infernum DSM 9756]|uniref:3-deoxy-D-manno-octulosonic acid transferase n=1 Tax=Desulfacinum infernum DSM 9756 TaxID=1121391 RepID=A0A1M4S8U0_9BACT|nr:3-deoxy-D-manno-octulosonic acid transferase [Desulfacinum infernum]SHE28620.1 3-deoxy-D-manno-octulosonic-acid transferase [Desulfacinum infernum DSM 9756]
METLLHLAYNAVLTAAWPALWLYYRLSAAVSGKYEETYRRRLGLEFPRLKDFPLRPVWIHALSVGEALSAIPLILELKDRLPTQPIVFSTATEKGLQIARNRVAALVDDIFVLPHDLGWTMRRLVRGLRPSLFVLVETDIWPNLLRELRKAQTPAVLVNARLSPRSHGRLRRLAPFVAALFRHFSAIFTQSRLDAERYRSLGVPPRRVHAAGNLKFDLVVMQAEGYAGEDLDLFPGEGKDGRKRPVWIAGSTHPGEESLLVEAHGAVRARYPHALLILAPRHIERAPRIASLCARAGLEPALRSRRDPPDSAPVLILDTLGELARCYALADAAFIGGSLVPTGGHNPLEASVHGVPCCWGPHLFNFREVEAFLLQAGCGRVVRKAADVAAFVLDAFDRGKDPSAARPRCRQAVRNHAGAARRIARLLAHGLTQRP